RGGGGVLNVASTAAYQPVPHFAVYAATKAYVRAFTEALHAELAGTGVRATVLVAGPTETGFAEAADLRFVTGGLTERAEAVARVGLRGLARGRRVATSGWLNRITTTATRFAPNPLSMAVGGALLRRAARTRPQARPPGTHPPRRANAEPPPPALPPPSPNPPPAPP